MRYDLDNRVKKDIVIRGNIGSGISKYCPFSPLRNSFYLACQGESLKFVGRRYLGQSISDSYKVKKSTDGVCEKHSKTTANRVQGRARVHQLYGMDETLNKERQRDRGDQTMI